MAKKLIINARINEWMMRAPNRHVPWTADEIAEDAARCREAGAALVHVHARNADGSANHSPEAYQDLTGKIRGRSDILIHATLGNLHVEGDETRISHVGEARPDLATIDIGSTNRDVYDGAAHSFTTTDRIYRNSTGSCLFFAQEMARLGVKPHVACWTVPFLRTLEAFIDLGALAEPVVAQMVLSGGGDLSAHPPTPAGLEAFFHALPDPRRIEWTVCALDANIFPAAAVAIARGGHVAPGIGDYPYPELGYPSNAALVAEIVKLAKAMGREVATPEEARAMLGMPTRAD